MCIKRKVSISCLGGRLGICLLLAFVPQLLFAQEDSVRFIRDSIQIQPEFNESLFSPFELPSENSAPSSMFHPEHSYSPARFFTERVSSSALSDQSFPAISGRLQYKRCIKTVSSRYVIRFRWADQRTGYRTFQQCFLGYQHAFNQRLTLQLGVDAMKINMIHSTGQAFSTSGALRYQASDRVAFKVFGSYAIGNTYGMDTHRYGATMSLDMSERFGMEVGVQRYYDAYRGRWETVPVVIPYYNFDKFKLSLDVGGILYEILRNTVFDNRGAVAERLLPHHVFRCRH